MTALLALPLATLLHVWPPAPPADVTVGQPVASALTAPSVPSIRAAADAFARSAAAATRQTAPPQQRPRSWASRHPVLCGTLVGLIGGAALGVAGGTDGILDDFSAEGNALILGSIGAGAGAIVGWIVSR